VVAVDLPLVPELLGAFRATGVLSTNNVNDPYSPSSTGFLPGEAAVAVTLERGPSTHAWCSVESYAATSDAYDSVALPADGSGMADCLKQAVNCSLPDPIAAVCPHATGTTSHAQAELASLRTAFQDNVPLSCILLKPYTGHALGASGLLDVALLAAYLKRGLTLPNLPGLARGAHRFALPSAPIPLPDGSRLVKLSAGMGGHNAAVVLQAPLASLHSKEPSEKKAEQCVAPNSGLRHRDQHAEI
jgi:3-oxoacyl-(acyl-carrier-protein) synthase